MRIRRRGEGAGHARSARPANRFASVALLAIAAAGCRIEATESPGGAGQGAEAFRQEVREILRLSAEAWNRGDLDGFMEHYERAATTTYVGASGLIEGWDGIRARYAPLFEPGAARDSLRFTGLHTRVLGPGFGLAIARFVLERDGEVTATGPFTLLLMRVGGAWKITHDQSASDPLPESSEGE